MTIDQSTSEPTRCSWVSDDPVYIDYHDNEWGVPSHDETYLFEMLILEGCQAGLSWITVLKKRPHYRKVFHQFDMHKVAAMTDDELEVLLLDPGIIRNRLKVFGARKNALAAIKLVEEFGSLDNYFWGWTKGETIVTRHDSPEDYPTTSELSDKISKDLKKRGFTFVGSTIIYSYLQAIGVLDDHQIGCFKAT